MTFSSKSLLAMLETSQTAHSSQHHQSLFIQALVTKNKGTKQRTLPNSVRCDPRNFSEHSSSNGHSGIAIFSPIFAPRILHLGSQLARPSVHGLLRLAANHKTHISTAFCLEMKPFIHSNFLYIYSKPTPILICHSY